MKSKQHDIAENISHNLILLSVIFICRSPGNVMDGLGFKSWQVQEIYLSSKAFRLAHRLRQP
jgi:hypothetical protein